MQQKQALEAPVVFKRSSSSEPQCQVKLEQLVIRNRIHLGNILVRTARSQRIVVALCLTVAQRSNNRVSRTVRSRHEPALHIGTPLEKVGVHQVGVKRKSFHALKVKPGFPSSFFGRAAIDRTLAGGVRQSGASE